MSVTWPPPDSVAPPVAITRSVPLPTLSRKIVAVLVMAPCRFSEVLLATCRAAWLVTAAVAPSSRLPRSRVWITPPPAVFSVPPVMVAVCRSTWVWAPLAWMMPAAELLMIVLTMRKPPVALSAPGLVASSSMELATTLPLATPALPVAMIRALAPVASMVPPLVSLRFVPMVPAPTIMVLLVKVGILGLATVPLSTPSMKFWVLSDRVI